MTSRSVCGSAILAGLVALAAGTAQAQWTTESPVPTHLDIRGVGATSADHMFCATSDDSFDDGGALWESSDGGVNWVQRDVPFSLSSPLNGLFFLDSMRGWAHGNANYRTLDGGATWEELPFLGSTYEMVFHTPNFGYASTNGNEWISTDGGLNWIVTPNDLRRFSFDPGDDLIGIGAAPGGFYRTVDGGATFTLTTAGAATDVVMLTTTLAVGIIDDSFTRSTDGGQTWTVISPADGRGRLVNVSTDVILAWGFAPFLPNDDGQLYRSGDGGQTWTDLGTVFPEGTVAVVAVAGGGVVGTDVSGNMHHSADAGATWSQAYTSPGPKPGFLSSAKPAFGDALTGYYGFGAGFVIKTTDGGANWQQISSGSGESLNDLDRFDNGDMIAVGDRGTILVRAPASPWTLVSPFTTADLMGVDVVGAGAAVIADDTGRVHRTTDGGVTWVAGLAAAPSLTPADLAFTTVLDGWVTGSGFSTGAVFHTTDGGDTWTPVPGFLGLYTGIDFQGASGWALNVSGNYYRTTDSGATWSPGELPGADSVNDLEFFDASTGYAVGRWGYAARSADGGDTWSVLATPDPDHNLTDLHVTGPNELWVSTADDFVYYSATGGQSWAPLSVGSDGFGSFHAVHATPEGAAWTAGWQGFIEHFPGPPPPPDNLDPVASFDFDPTGLSVDFTDTSTDADGVIVSWFWDFGDGTSTMVQHPSHTFPGADTYIVRLTVTDDNGAEGSGVRFIVVQPGPGGTFGDFTEVTPLDPLFLTPQDEDFWVSSTAPADFDGDGDLDIAVLGFYVVYSESVDHQLVLFRNGGLAGPGEWEFEYIDVPLGGLSSGASDMAWGDVDNDGDEDLVLGSNGVTVIYRNDDGTLVLSDTVLPGYDEDNDQADFDLQSITLADYDNDSDLDLLLPSVWDGGTFSYRTALMRNDGDNGTGGWVFTETDSVFAPTRHAQSFWADWDADEDLDLLLVNLEPLTDRGFIRRYRNDGGGVFVPEDILGSLTIEHGEAQWGDFDEDGDFDVLVAGNIGEVDGSTTAAALRIYRNDAEVYTAEEVIDCISCEGWAGTGLTAATWADYDSDGDVDILLAGSYNSGSQIDGRARIYTNDGGVFVESGTDLPAPQASGTRGGTFSWMDIDGDNDLDYFIAGQYFVPGGGGLVEAQMHVYRNDVPANNAVPTSPTNLSTVVDETTGSVAFSWTPSTDDHTPSSALTYELDVFQGGTPAALPRRLPEPGNVSIGSDWTLAGLGEGVFTWRLRAVDSAYSGSAEAEGSFTVGDVVTTGESTPELTYALFTRSASPFSTLAKLAFALPERTWATVNVYDVRGRMVDRLVAGQFAPGVHELEWNPPRAASGTYFVQLVMPAFRQTRRVVLVR